jgi:hypothetical protein
MKNPPTFPVDDRGLFGICACVTLGGVFRVQADHSWTMINMQRVLQTGFQPLIWLDDPIIPPGPRDL